MLPPLSRAAARSFGAGVGRRIQCLTAGREGWGGGRAAQELEADPVEGVRDVSLAVAVTVGGGRALSGGASDEELVQDPDRVREVEIAGPVRIAADEWSELAEVLLDDVVSESRPRLVAGIRVELVVDAEEDPAPAVLPGGRIEAVVGAKDSRSIVGGDVEGDLVAAEEAAQDRRVRGGERRVAGDVRREGRRERVEG